MNHFTSSSNIGHQTFLEDLKGLKDSPVAHNLMCSGDEEETLLLWYDEFVTAFGVLAHELAVQ